MSYPQQFDLFAVGRVIGRRRLQAKELELVVQQPVSQSARRRMLQNGSSCRSRRWGRASRFEHGGFTDLHHHQRARESSSALAVSVDGSAVSVDGSRCDETG